MLVYMVYVPCKAAVHGEGTFTEASVLHQEQATANNISQMAIQQSQVQTADTVADAANSVDIGSLAV